LGLTGLGHFRTSPNTLGWRPAPKFLSAHKVQMPERI
jgi:hypothetical protein